MSNHFDTIKNLLPKLSLDELNTVVDSCKALKQFARNKDTYTDSGGPHDIVLSAISEVMSKLGGELPDIPLIKRSPEFPAFKKKCVHVINFFKPVGTKNEQFAALCLGIELLYRELTKMRMMTTSRRIIRHIHAVPAAIDQSFPEYAKCGLLHMIITKKDKHNARTE